MNTRILYHPTQGDEDKQARWFICLPFIQWLAIPEDPVSSKHPGASDTGGRPAAVVWDRAWAALARELDNQRLQAVLEPRWSDTSWDMRQEALGRNSRPWMYRHLYLMNTPNRL